MNISIHALREEGDEDALDFLFEVLGFLSTPSARRATQRLRCGSCPEYGISIHALREEGDPVFCGHVLLPPVISIHALREEGDHDPQL